MSRKCNNTLCNIEIPDGEQVAVWQTVEGNLRVFFVCENCSKLLEQQENVEQVNV